MKKHLFTRILSCLLAAVLLGGEITSVAFAASVSEPATESVVLNSENENAKTAEVTVTGGESGDVDITAMTEEEMEEMAKKAALNVDSLLAESEEGTKEESDNASVGDTDGTTAGDTDRNSYTATSDGGATTIEIQEETDGSRNLLFNSDEELVKKDESEVTPVEGYEYVGTGSESGVDIYRQTIKYEDLAEYQAANALEEASLQKKIDRMNDWLNTPDFTDDEINAALIVAERHAAQTRNKYFGAPEEEKTVIKRKKAEAADREEVDGVLFEKVESESLDPEEAEAMIASPSNAQRRKEEDYSLSTSGDDAKEEPVRTEETAEGETAETEETAEGETAEGETAEEESAEEEEFETIVLAPGETLEEEDGYEYEYLESGKPEDLVLLREPEEITTDAIVFSEGVTEVTEAGDEAEEYGLSTASVFDGHQTVSAEVLILRKDCVYFQINDENGKGINGAAVTLVYKKNSSSQELTVRNLVTARVNGHDGSVYADDMEGDHDCFVDISVSGYRTQTYFCSTLKGGTNYTYQMVPAKAGDVYLRGASIDDVDICFDTNELTVSDQSSPSYDIRYLVSVEGETDAAKVPSNINLRVKPKLPSDGTYRPELAYKYRDRYFKANEKNYASQAGDKSTATKMYSITAEWSALYDEGDVPLNRPASGFDDLKKVRLKADDTVYVELPEGYTWAGTASSIQPLKLTVVSAVTSNAWWQNLTFNLSGVTPQGTGAGGVQFNSDIPGLKNARLDCSLFNFRLLVTVSLSGYGMVGYNLNGTLKEFYNSLKAQNELQSRPKIDWRAKNITQRYQALKEDCFKRCNPVAEKVLDPFSNSRTTGIGSITSNIYASIAGVFAYDRKTGYYNLDITSKVVITGKGEITGYIMIGPVPAFAGIRGVLTGTVEGDAGMKFHTGFTDVAMSNAMRLSLGLQFALTGYAGVGLHGVLCAEVEGGGNIGFVYTPVSASATNLPFVATGGWNFGYRITFFFLNFSASIFAKQYQLYPEVKLLSGLQGAANGEEEYESGDIAISLGSEDCCIVIPGEPEGIAMPQSSRGASGERQYLATLAPTDTSGDEYDTVLAGEGGTAQTKLLKKDIANSKNLQYVSTSDESGVLLRIAYIEETDEQGNTRVLPRVIASLVDKKGIVQGKEYVMPTSKDDNEYLTEPGILGYDYAFSATSEEVDGKRYVYVGINSGRIDVADANKLANKTSEEILEMAAEDNHLRVIGFNADTGEIVLNDFVCKNQISVNGTFINQDYMYTGTPAVLGHKVGDTFCYWITSTVSSQYRVNNGIPDGYTYAMWNKDGESYGTRVDGICRTNIQMVRPSDYNYGLNKYNRNKLVAVVADKAVETEKIGKDGKIEYVQPDSGQRTAKEATKVRVDEVWFTQIGGTFQTQNRGVYEYQKAVGNLSHINNDPLADICFTTGNELYRMSNVWPKPGKVEIKTENGGTVQLPEGSDVLSYHEIPHPGENVLKLLSCYVTQTEVKGEKKTDSAISIMTFRNNVLEGESESKVDNRSVILFTAGFMKEDEKDYEAGLRLYYLADENVKEVSRIHEEIGIRGVSDLCNVYVWNWKATYGAVLKSLTPVEKEVAAEKKVVRFNISVKNTGPQALESVTVSYTTDLNDQKKFRNMEVTFPYKVNPGNNVSAEIQIPIESDWNGWIRVYAAVTKVDGHESTDAGFIPVWVNSGDLLGKLDLEAYPYDNGYKVNLVISDWEKQIAEPQNVQLKAYYKYWSEEGKFVWDTAPSHVYSLKGVVEEKTLYYNFNVDSDLRDSEYWFRGFYKSDGKGGLTQLESETDVIAEVDFTKAVAAVKFELCGYGDDTWNVVYDSEEVTNPMMSNLCWLSVSSEDYKRGDVAGGGYILADGYRELLLKACPYEGSKVKCWEIKEGEDWVEYQYYRPVKEDDLTEIYVVPQAGTRLLEFRAVFIPDKYCSWFDLGVSKDKTTGADLAQVKVLKNGMEEVTARGYGGGLMYCYGLNYAENSYLLEVTYDDREQLFHGLYYAEITLKEDGTRSVVYVDANDRTKKSTDYNDVKPFSTYQGEDITYQLSNNRHLQVMAVLEKQPGKIITFDPMEGRLQTGARSYEITDRNGILPSYLFDESSSLEKRGILYGYNFDGWWTEPEGGERITKDNVGSHVFTEDTTLYAHYSVRPAHMMTVRLADEYYGKVIVKRPMEETTPEAVTVFRAKYFDYQPYEIHVQPAEGYEFINQGEGACDVKFYKQKADGSWEEYSPGLNRSSDCVWFMYKEDVGDVLIVPQVRKKADSDVNLLRVDGDLLDGVRPAGSYTVTADSSKYSVLGDNVYRVAKDLSVTVKAEPVTDEASFGDWYFYTLDPMGNRVFEPEPVSTKAEVTFTVSSDTNIYAQWLRKQSLSFARDTVEVTYGISQPVTNPLAGAQTAVTYSLSGAESGGKTIATIDPSTGAVTVLGAGTVTVNADAAKSEEYGRAHAEYTLTIGRKSLTVPTVHALAGMNSVAVYDGKTKLTEGTDYTYTRELVYSDAETYKVVYTVTGAGNYKDTIKADTEKQIELWQFGVAEVSADIPETKRLTAEAAAAKTGIALPEELDETLAQKILNDAIAAKKITDAESKAAQKVIIAVIVKAELTALEEATGRYDYKLTTLAGIQLYDGTDVKTVTLPVNASWFDTAKNVQITVGAGNHINRMLHRHENGQMIRTYKENTTAAVGIGESGSFVYDPKEKTATTVLSCFGDGTENFTTLQTVNAHNLFVQAVREEYGTVSIEGGTKAAKVQFAEAYESGSYRADAYPSESYEWDKLSQDAWTVYTKNAEGLWEENKKLAKPVAEESEAGGLFTMPDEDVLLVAEITRTESAPLLLELDGTREEGELIGTAEASAEKGKITEYGSLKYKVAKNTEVTLTETHDASRYFIGWFGFTRDINGKPVMDTEAVSKESTALFKPEEEGGIFAKWGTWQIQSLSFKETAPSVMYGTETCTNEVFGAKTKVTWTVYDQQPLSGQKVADIDAETGVLTVCNAGTVKVTATAEEEAPWRSASKSYILTVTPKPMEEQYGVVMLADMNNCVVMDGFKVLEKGKDYTLETEHPSESLVTVYTATGIGNYSGELSAVATQEQKKWVESAAIPELSETIPEDRKKQAQELVSRAQVEMTAEKVPVDQIKEAVAGYGENKIPPEALALAADVLVYTVVYATLESYDPANNAFTYSFEPYGVIALTYGGTDYVAYTPLKEEWYSAERGIRVTVGVDRKPTKIEHVANDGTTLGTYTYGSNATSTNGKFVYDTAKKTVTVCIEHFSSLVITTEPEPEPAPTPSHDSAAGSVASLWNWRQDKDGKWYLEKGGHQYKDEWAYAYNPYANNLLSQNGYDWFAFDEKGVMRTGWFTDKDGAVYYLWTVSDNTLGRMLYGWQLIDGNWYYFEEKSNGHKGALYKGGYTPDGYYVLPDGRWDGKLLLRQSKF